MVFEVQTLHPENYNYSAWWKVPESPSETNPEELNYVPIHEGHKELLSESVQTKFDH